MRHDYPVEPITWDPSNVYLDAHGLRPQQLAELAPKLEAARDEMLTDVKLLRSGRPIPAAKEPLDAGFIDCPDRLLTEHQKNPAGSELARILKAASELQANLDRVVLIGIGGSYMGTRSLFEALCHPYHNQISRTDRQGRPRMFFVGYNADNDTTQGLLDILGRGRPVRELQERWGIIVVSKSGGTLEPAIAFRQFFNSLREATKNTDWAGRLVHVVTSAGSKLHELAREALSTEVFLIPPDIGGRYSIFTACGLLPAAVLGIDIVNLLKGASAMTAHFRSESLGSNLVMDYVGVCHLMEKERGATIRVLSLWDHSMEAFGFWHDQLLAESLGKAELGATPLTAVNTRDLHSRGQQHQQGRRDKLITNVILKRVRREPLPVSFSNYDQDGLNEIGNRTLPEIMKAAMEGTNRAYREDNRPTTNIYLPGADAASLGQMYQMFMLATTLEGYLLGINPYGQPGVEAYKRYMKVFLAE